MSTLTLDVRAHITWDRETAHDLAEHLAEQPDRKARVDLLEDAYGFPRDWADRNLNTLLRLTADQLMRVLQHADPTGEQATNRADAR
ncbi:hypothetical protein [Nesterenkonia populi]|uniref:hypothetical protein n=1 Tax=Nesterenkonia populi TaxID=1591087 RepID=UPI0011BF3659|nr:hypothetical protein [Nesterenkonia populi]